MGIFDKYLPYIALVIFGVALTGVFLLGKSMGTTSTMLSHTTAELDKSQEYNRQFSELTKINQAQQQKLAELTSENDRLLLERLRNGNLATQHLLDVLRDPTVSVYAEGNCGEAGNYPSLLTPSISGTGSGKGG